MSSYSHSRKVTPLQSATSDPDAKRTSLIKDAAKLSKAAASQELFSSHQDEEDNEMEKLLRLEKRMKLGLVHSWARSLKCLLFGVVLALILVSLMVSVVWFTVFLTNLIQLGDRARETAFIQLRKDVLDEISKMLIAGRAVSRITMSFHENTTQPDEMKDIIFQTHGSLLNEFTFLGIDYYPFNMRGVFSFSNLQDTRNTGLITGHKEWRWNDTFTTIHGYTKNPVTSEMDVTLAYTQPTNLLAMPQDFVQHILRMNQSEPVAFTEPVPALCFQSDSIPGFENGKCMYTAFKMWDSHVDETGLRGALSLYTTTDAFSATLKLITMPGATSFIITPSGKLMATSKHAEDVEGAFYHFNFSKSTLVQATEFGDESISSTSRAILKEYGSDLSSLGSELHSFRAGRYYVDFQAVPLTNTLDSNTENWPGNDVHPPEVYLRHIILVHVIPVNAFTKSSVTTGIVVICVSLAWSALSLIGVFTAACLINRPVKRLISQMEQVKNLELESVDVSQFTHFSELRRIQAAFYFLVLNLKQARAFLPPHVLQMIEARRMAHASKQSSKKKHRHHHKNSDKTLTTVEDELHSASTNDESAGAGRGSFSGSHRSASQFSHSKNLSHQFSLGMFRRQLSVCCVQIVNVKDMLNRVSLQDFVGMHSQLVDIIGKLVNVTHSATLNSFSQSTFFISLNTTISGSDYAKRTAYMAMLLKDRIAQLNERFAQQALEPFQVIISLSTSEALVSTLGTHTLKQQVIFGAPVEYAHMQLHAAQKLRRDGILRGNVNIVLDQATKERLPSKHIQSCIVDVLALKTRQKPVVAHHGAESTTSADNQESHWKFHYLFELQRVVHLETIKEQEWMYQMSDNVRKEQRTARNKTLTKAWALLVGESAGETAQILKAALKEVPADASPLSPGSGVASPVDGEPHLTDKTMAEYNSESTLQKRLLSLAEIVSNELYENNLELYCDERVAARVTESPNQEYLWASLLESILKETGV